MTRIEQSVIALLLLIGSVLLPAPPSGAATMWGEGQYGAWGTSPILCHFVRSGIDKLPGGQAGFRGQTLLMRDVFCTNFDLNVTAGAANVRTYLVKYPNTFCGATSWSGNSAREPLASAWAQTLSGPTCGPGTYYAYSEHSAWRHGAWRYAQSQSPLVTYP